MLAIYCRCSSDSQTTKSQENDLGQWLKAQTGEIRWYKDVFTGTTLDRPGMNRLLADIRSGQVKTLVVWRIDRLGRTAKGLTALFDELVSREINFISLKDGIDLGTPAGRLIANVLASVASYETEVRSERQRAGIEAAKAENGGACPWGGRKAGTRITLSEEKEQAVKLLAEQGKSKSEIARITGLSRQSVYKALGLWERRA
jgi:DNA invertase Pin-like site-specific DNA recombinase